MKNAMRTDVAGELLENLPLPDGVEKHTDRWAGVEVTTVHIDRAAEKTVGKPEGTYITVEDRTGTAENESIVRVLVKELKGLLLGLEGPVLVAGLGNRLVTPDSLGPRTCEKVFVTRHIGSHAPELAPDNLRQVAVMAPGVLGTTGMETLEVLTGVVDAIRPCAVLCIDALASLQMERIASVVQLNDSGILPGAGVGNRRLRLDRASLGVPVIAIGVPTVVHAGVIAGESARLLQEKTGMADAGDALAAMTAELMEERYPNFVMTLKDVDKLIEDASRRLSQSINRALHGENYEELKALTEA